MAKPTNATVRLSGIPAIILGYGTGTGILLVQHRSSPSLEDTLQKYLARSRGNRHWFASFKWASIERDDRQRLHAEQASYSARTPARKKERRPVGHLMCGLVVQCDLVKAPTWSAVRLKIDFTRRAMEIPKEYRRRPGGPRKRSNSSKPANVVERRLARLSASGRSNVAHPWRG